MKPEFRSASPGNLAAFEDELLRGSDAVELPVVMAVTLLLQGGVRRVGVAYLDAGRHRLGAAEFADDEQFCTLEAVALQLGAKECAVLKVPSCSAGEHDLTSRVNVTVNVTSCTSSNSM